MSATVSTVSGDESSAANTRPISGGSLAGALWALYVLTLRQHLHGKRWLVMAVLFLCPAALALLLRVTAPDVPPVGLEFLLLMMFIPQALLPIAALLYASGIIQDEQEDQTITYLLIRPIPKWAIYVVKLLATITTTVLLVAFFTVLTFVIIHAQRGTEVPALPLRSVHITWIHALAVVAYCSLFGLIGLLTKRTLVFGILYTAIVEGLLANLPFGIRLMTVIYYTRVIAYRTLEFVVATPGGTTEDLAAEAWQIDAQSDPQLLEHPQLDTCVLVLLGASVVCTILAAWLCAQREFHVKTPEKE